MHPPHPLHQGASTNNGRLLSIMNRCGDLCACFRVRAYPRRVMLIGGVG